jgi:hypothetical protein
MFGNLLPNTGDQTLNLDRYLLSVNRSVRDKNFTGSPLYITMIATVFCEMDMTLHSNTDERNHSNIDLINLFELFVENKLCIYVTQKKNANMANPCVLDDLENLKETLFNQLEKCALVAILPATILESLHDKNIEEEIQPFLAKVQAGKDKTGIMMNVVDGQPQFVHRTFGEYFAASWFSKNFKHNRSMLQRILFDRTYGVMTDMFNRMLAKDCPLHCSVINIDQKSLDTLLEEGCDVSVLDKGGRNFMHLVATHDCILRDERIYKFGYEFDLDTTDSVLQWTPMQYAIKLEKWYIVERLLDSNVSRFSVEMIRQRAHDRSYIDAIFEEAQVAGLQLLHKLLHRMCKSPSFKY